MRPSERIREIYEKLMRQNNLRLGQFGVWEKKLAAIALYLDEEHDKKS